jgi:hypothetical protein
MNQALYAHMNNKRKMKKKKKGLIGGGIWGRAQIRRRAKGNSLIQPILSSQVSLVSMFLGCD